MGIIKSGVKLRIKDYPFLDDQTREYVDYIIQNSLRANPILRVGRKKVKPKQMDFWKLSWSDIILLRVYVGDKDIKAVNELVYGTSEKDFLKLQLLNSSACYKWVVDQLNHIAEIEKQELGDSVNNDLKEAGIDRLNEFGYSATLDELAKGNLLIYDQWLELPYMKIFRKLCLNKVKGEIQKNHNEIVSRKTKRVNRRF
ncbi:hypothetical protein [Aegicerativicinus sediminis]|uniref:hypothetical protein n=1 Tax=Aegicerativicinus sediminis TaxID=2893202 RepID=UPI001E5B60C7|nr:hypothetical protein [Aegicerativicinus sediminis]